MKEVKEILSLLRNKDSGNKMSKEIFSARKGNLIGPSFGHIYNIQPEKVMVLEKSQNNLWVTVKKEHYIEFSKDTT
jgi:hypothetical protein